MRTHRREVFMLTILDENYDVKEENKLDFLGSNDSFGIEIAVCKDGDIIFIKGNDPHVYVCDKTGQLKYKFERDSSKHFH